MQVGDTTGALGKGDVSGVAAGATGGVRSFLILQYKFLANVKWLAQVEETVTG